MKPLLRTYPVQRSRMALNNLLPDKQVRRRVQGVELVLPRSHPLPLYTQGDSPYGANLVELARGLGASGDLTVLDVGANIGDSAARVLNAVAGRGRVVCVEPDPEWLPYLEQNAARCGNTVIEKAFLVPTDELRSAVVAVHDSPGTTRFETNGAAPAITSLTPSTLRDRHPELSSVRLVKSDTDGYDVTLVPALAETFAASRPVVFFEYDPRLTKLAQPEVDPESVWSALEQLGWTELAIWDNGGSPIGRVSTAKVHGQLHRLIPPPGAKRRKAKVYWDVAAVHRDDVVGQAVIENLVPAAL